ncbi:MAG: methyltransferase [Roseiflexaceae bacterium]|nr:methyltransferase [Roseiflexaceae bacterium]
MTTLDSPIDIYYKKRLDYAVRGERFAFDIAHTLFSSHQIDEGSDLFLRTIDVAPPTRVLDIGCGVGVLGIVLARLFPHAQVICSDRDLLAVRYARQNALLNATPNVEVLGSVGFEQIPSGPYDLIISNIPAKVGDDAIEHEFILGPLAHLRPGGDYWFVVVSGLNHIVPKVGVRHNLNMKQVKKRAGYSVYHVKAKG